MEITDIASPALADTALHPLFQGSYHLLLGETQFGQNRKCKPYHNWWSADNSYRIAG
jgi:hypothetical protein